MNGYDRVGGFNGSIWRKKKSNTIGWIIAILAGLFIIGSCSNDAEGQAVTTLIVTK